MHEKNATYCDKHVSSRKCTFFVVNIVKPDAKIHRPVVGMPVISVKIGDHCYHGLCDMGASASPIPISLYQEIMHDIAPVELEDIDVTIKLANRILLGLLGLLEMLKSCVGRSNTLLIFLFSVPPR